MYLAQKGLAKSIYSKDSIDSFTSYGSLSSIELFEFENIKKIFKKILIFTEDTKISIINISKDEKLYKLLNSLKTEKIISNITPSSSFSKPQKRKII